MGGTMPQPSRKMFSLIWHILQGLAYHPPHHPPCVLTRGCPVPPLPPCLFLLHIPVPRIPSFGCLLPKRWKDGRTATAAANGLSLLPHPPLLLWFQNVPHALTPPPLILIHSILVIQQRIYSSFLSILVGSIPILRYLLILTPPSFLTLPMYFIESAWIQRLKMRPRFAGRGTTIRTG